MRALVLALFMLVTVPAIATDNLIHRPSGRVMPALVDAECQYVETPWGGSTCRVSPEDCILRLTPMFVETTNRTVLVQLKSNKTVVDAEVAIDFSTVSVMKIKYVWGIPLSWVEWYTKDPGEVYGIIPLMGCYCNELTNVITTCFKGRVEE